MTEAKDNPLKGLHRLVGGRWYYQGPDDAPLAYHAFRSKLNDKLIVAESYTVGEDEKTLVSEGIWYWNPAEERIKAIGIAQHMEVDVFEYTNVKVEGDTMTCDLTAHNDQGSSEFVETWEFPNNDRYEWTLFAKSPEGLQKVMDASFSRKR